MLTVTSVSSLAYQPSWNRMVIWSSIPWNKLTYRVKHFTMYSTSHRTTLLCICQKFVAIWRCLFSGWAKSGWGNQFLDTSVVPKDWSSVTVSSIFKSGDKSCPQYYRPISLTSSLAKVMEKLFRERVLSHLQEQVVISGRQHGFLSCRSCILNLLLVESMITRILENNDAVDIIILDFAKAFDKVNHAFILLKMESYDIAPAFIQWTKAFLTERTFRVGVNGRLAPPTPAPSGVPQVSVLAPFCIWSTSTIWPIS